MTGGTAPPDFGRTAKALRVATRAHRLVHSIVKLIESK